MSKIKTSSLLFILGYVYVCILVTLGLLCLATDSLTSKVYATIMVGVFGLGLLALKFIKR